MSRILRKAGLAGVLMALCTGAWSSLASAHALGERVFNIPRGAFARIVGMQSNATFVLRFESGPLTGQTGTGWTRADLATLAGCSGDLCVGQTGYLIHATQWSRSRASSRTGASS